MLNKFSLGVIINYFILILMHILSFRTCSTCASISTERETIIRTSNRTIYTAGRPPWYNQEGQLMDTFVIGVCGGSARFVIIFF